MIVQYINPISLLFIFAISQVRSQDEETICPVIRYNYKYPLEINDKSDDTHVAINLPYKGFAKSDEDAIKRYNVIVGKTEACVMGIYDDLIGKPYNPDCFVSHVKSADELNQLADENGNVQFSLSKEDCKNRNNPCNQKLTVGTSYYVVVRGLSDCDIDQSPTLNLTIAQPFPIGVAIGVPIGVVGFIIIIAFIVMLFLKYFRDKTSIVPVGPYKPFPVEQLGHVISNLSKGSNYNFQIEYLGLEEVAPRCEIRKSDDERRLLDRYVDVRADGSFGKSRVKITRHDGDDYINANFIPGIYSSHEYIAAQGPMENTIDDFWQMINEHKIDFVIMLTNCEDTNGKKCEKYWPDPSESTNYGGNIVTNESEIQKNDYTIRHLLLRTGDKTSRVVKQYHYHVWNDHTVPNSAADLLDFVKTIRNDIKTKRLTNGIQHPILINCSAGIGRTGAYIAIDRLLLQIERGENIDVYNTVLYIRNYRYRLVQTENQYSLIYYVLYEAYKRLSSNETNYATMSMSITKL